MESISDSELTTDHQSHIQYSSHRDPPKILRIFISIPHTPKSAVITNAATSFRASAIPACDKVVDFGKYKGRMLGSLLSPYLKWVSKNLRADDMEEWARLSDQVLDDQVYRDRIEWEVVEKILNREAASHCSKESGSNTGFEVI